jgi:DNA mismatch endonuclease, patch repair protein
MPDIYSKKKRSSIMSKIKGRNTSPELVTRSFLHKAGIRFRIHVRELPGIPDIVMPRHHMIVFVHGCFWHQHSNCNRATFPKTNARFWKRKIEGNVKRDRGAQFALKQMGWEINTIWTCQLKNERLRFLTLNKLVKDVLRHQSNAYR